MFSVNSLPMNPLAGALAATGHVQQTAAAERARRVARERSALRDHAVDPATDERQVEDSTEIDAVHPDEHHNAPGRKPGKRQTPDDDDRPTLDITA